MRTLHEIIKAAGGARGIEEATGGDIKRDAVYKWPQIGIPDRHWVVVIDLAKSSAEELYQANLAARSPSSGDAEAAA